ncbi:MAG: hypothetical protein Q7R45_14560 [Sulfuricaulis sp.]|nr:hypothetical protein [Sulfuricaulis sp.]
MTEFSAFWSAYPSRRPHPHPKQPAQAAWERATRAGADPAVILAGAQAYASYAATEAVEPRYVCHAATWLNQRRWEQYTEVEPAEKLAALAADEKRARKHGELMRQLAARIKTLRAPVYYIPQKDVDEMLSCGLISAEDAARAGYAVPGLRMVG